MYKRLSGPRGIRKFIQLEDVTIGQLYDYFNSLLPSERLEFLRKYIDNGFIFPESIPTFIAFKDHGGIGPHFIVSNNPDMLNYQSAIQYYLDLNKKSNYHHTTNGGKRKSKRSKKQRKHKTRKH